jgi:regulator of protease activity HflC (stomatin/prohibitin superfamily)
MKTYFYTTILLAMLASCTTVRQTEVGVRRNGGKLQDRVLESGMYAVGPFSRIIKVPIRTVNLPITADLPTQEGLTVITEMSILYRLDKQQIPALLKTVGENYEQVVMLPVFRSVVRDVSARFMAKDLHTSERSKIEQVIKTEMDKYLREKGVMVDAVLLKSVKLPQELSTAIEQKLRTEQESIRMQFVLDRERQEAERKKIEAAGIRDAQKIISEGLNPLLLNWRAIEAFKELSKSNNAKVIITDGKTPLITQLDDKTTPPVVSQDKKEEKKATDKQKD